jgi:benzoyl-CoA reductase/2-hydroxyglutaryl-CoA dehydratase subunit BcrC/BadD/HgdB
VSALAELRRAYERRAAPAAGRKTVGVAGGTVPVELVRAAGARAVDVSPGWREPTPDADRYLERHNDDDARATLQAALDGRLEWLDLLVLPRTSDAFVEIYHTLKELVRLGRGDAVPPLHLYDLLHGRSAANGAYGLERTRELRSRLSATTGVTVTDDGLRAAIREANAARAAIRRLLDARRDPAAGIPGVDALVAIGAGRFLEPRAHAELLAAYLEEHRPALARRPRLLVISAVPLSDVRLHEVLEGAGGVVVAEDDAWGAPAGGRDVPEEAPDPLAAVFDRVFLDVPSPHVAPAAARDEWLRGRIAEGGIDAAIVFIPETDQWFGWDHPRLRALLDGAGIPSLLLRDLDASEVAGFLQ